MVKVHIIRKIGIGIAGASGLLATGGGAIGCSGNPGELGTTAASNLTEATDPGTGTITLSPQSYEVPQYASTSGGDEYIRVGESINFTLLFTDALELVGLYNYETPPTAADIPKVSASVALTYLKNGQTVRTQTLPITFTPSSAQVYSWAGTTETIVIPRDVDQVTIVHTITNVATGATSTVNADATHQLPIYGADLPDKNAIFDTNGGSYRTRVVEGGGAVPGANLTIAYSDYRADTFANKTALDTYIGNQETYNRFGSTGSAPETGNINYNIVAVISFDGGQTFSSVQLNEVVNSDQILPKQYWPQRIGYEAKVPVPANATGIQIAFHVQALLTASYNPETTYKKYNDGQQVTVFDSWDNNGSQNYALPVDTQ